MDVDVDLDVDTNVAVVCCVSLSCVAPIAVVC